MWLETFVLFVAMCLVFGSGVRMGYMWGRQDAEEAADRMLRIDPPNRTPGLPTNASEPTSDLRRPRWRSGQFKAAPPRK